MTETEFAQSFARQLRERIVSQHGQEVAALLGTEWFDSVGVAVTEFATSVAASARREALEEARRKIREKLHALHADGTSCTCAWCVSIETAAASVRALVGEVGGEGETQRGFNGKD